MKTFADYGIDLRGRTGEVKTTCPKCSPTRKKKNYPCLSVNTEKGLWNCWHCSWSGSLHKGEEHQSVSPTKPTYRKPVWHEPLALDKRARDFLHRRGITDEVIERAKIGFTRVYMPQVEDEVDAIEFPFFRDGEVVNVKYRQIDQKNFRMYGGAERILYGLDDINDEEVVIVEGEMDKLACAVAGYWSCVSVPDGAPAPNTKDYASKFSFLDTDRLANVKRFVLATDADAPGEALREELARRLGRERCWLVDFDGAKDANEYLLKNGADALSRALREAKPYPIQGLVEIDDVADKVKVLYEHGWPRGLCTGWKCLDQFYTVRPGELTIVTGIPNSGKSNWLDALLVNMAKIHNWRFALFSPENQPIEDHAGRIAEKFINAPFREGARRRMGEDELHVALNWIGDHFSWILPSDDSDWSLDNVLSIAKSLVQRKGIQGLVIDPWNELEQYRAPGMSETEYVSACLKRIRQFARAHGIHVWVVAHPAKLYRDNGKYPVPTLYDISGCYSYDTEVLTKRGWLPHSEVTLVDEVACFDPATNAMRYCRPSRIIRKPYSGPMHRFRGYGYDLLVTPEHRMVVMPDWDEPNGRQSRTGIGRPVRFPKGQWSFCEAQALPSSDFKIPLAAPLADPPSEEVPELLARLAGWYVSEGSAVSSGVSIAQGVGDRADEIEALLVALAIPYSVQHSAPGGKGGTVPMKNFYIGVRGAREVVGWLREHCGIGSANKRIPASIFSSSASVKAAFLEAYLAGDGSPGRNGTYRATTTSVRLRDDLQRLALELGLSSSWHARAPASVLHAPSWQVNIGRDSRAATSLRTRRNGSIEQYNGTVWCLTVPTGAYFVRRNGKAVACGNSAHWRNKADNGICVWRELSEINNGNEVQIYVQKVRFRQVGRVGCATLVYEAWTGNYIERL